MPAEAKVWDESKVPISLFMERNKWGIDAAVDRVRDSLLDAKKVSVRRLCCLALCDVLLVGDANYLCAGE
jgi:hypothetical protein